MGEAHGGANKNRFKNKENMTYLFQLTLEFWSHIAGVAGLVAVVVTSVLAWRKSLLSNSFATFQIIYRNEMDEFKKTVREYINKNDERHEKTLNRIVELFTKTHEEIAEQNRVCGLVQAAKPYQAKQDQTWKDKIERDIDKMNNKLTHIENIVKDGQNNRSI